MAQFTINFTVKIKDQYNRTEDITPDEVRQFEKYKNWTDEEISGLIETIKAYTRFIYNVCSKRQKDGKQIALPIETEKLKAA